MVKEYGLNGQYFNEVRDFYHFFRSMLDEQGIRTGDGMRIISHEGNAAEGKPATGVMQFSSPGGKMLLEVNISLFRARIEEFFADYQFNNAVVKNVGDVNEVALERVIAAVHAEQQRRSQHSVS